MPYPSSAGRRLLRSILIALSATSLLLAAANSAAAAPPPNDDRSNAIVLDDPLPVTVNGDSSEAVELDATDPVNPCTGTVLPYSLWYEYTPLAAGGVVLDWQPQTLDGVLTAYQVLRNGLLRFVDCAGAGDRLLPLQQGERHLFVVTSYPPEPMFGGSFTFSLRAAPPPVEVEDVHVIQATYNPRTAVARLLGSATCSVEAPNSAMLGRIRQVDRRTNQIIEETWHTLLADGCGPGGRPFEVVILSQQQLSAGQIYITADIGACDRYTCDNESWTQTVRMRRAHG